MTADQTGESGHQYLVDYFAHELARARFGSGVDMGGKHNPLPSERITACRMVEDAAAYFGRSGGSDARP